MSQTNGLPKINSSGNTEATATSSDNVNLKATPPSESTTKPSLKKGGASSEDPMTSGGSPPIGRIVRDYRPTEEEELSLKEGDVVKVLKRYYKVQYGDRIGYLPASLVKVVDEPKKSSKNHKSKRSSHKKQHHSRKHYSSTSGSSSCSESGGSSEEREDYQYGHHHHHPRSHHHRHHHHGHRHHGHRHHPQSEDSGGKCGHQCRCKPQTTSANSSSPSTTQSPEQVTSSETPIQSITEKPTAALAQNEPEASKAPAQVQEAENADRMISQQTSTTSVLGGIMKSIHNLVVEEKDKVLDACPGTQQGHDGWYSRRKERYYFRLQSTKHGAPPDWELIYGPIDEKQFQSLAKKVLDENTCVELPPTELHPSGYYLNLNLHVQLGRDIIMTACKGTEQGQNGWYAYNKHERYYFELKDSNGVCDWILIYGPIKQEKFKLIAQEVKETGKRVQLPCTTAHKKPFYLEPNLHLTKGWQ